MFTVFLRRLHEELWRSGYFWGLMERPGREWPELSDTFQDACWIKNIFPYTLHYGALEITTEPCQQWVKKFKKSGNLRYSYEIIWLENWGFKYIKIIREDGINTSFRETSTKIWIFCCGLIECHWRVQPEMRDTFRCACWKQNVFPPIFVYGALAVFIELCLQSVETLRRIEGSWSFYENIWLKERN